MNLSHQEEEVQHEEELHHQEEEDEKEEDGDGEEINEGDIPVMSNACGQTIQTTLYFNVFKQSNDSL